MSAWRSRITLLVACSGLFVAALDNTILNVALPSLNRQLGASTSELQWIVDSYVIVYAGLLLTGGSLADRFGRTQVLRIGLMVFGAASAAAAMSNSATTLIMARGALGVGGALITPATLSIVTGMFSDPAERAKAIGIWSAVGSLGVASGPLIGGLLLTRFWWGSVFLVNVPVTAVLLLVGRSVLPPSREPEARRPDVVGAVLSTVALTVLLWAVIGAPERGWGSSGTTVALIGAFVVLGGFVAWETLSDDPIFDLRLFRQRTLSAATVSMVALLFGMGLIGFLNTQYLQLVKGYSPLAAGIRATPLAVAAMAAGLLTARACARFGVRVVISFGLSLQVLAGLVLLSIGATTNYWIFFGAVSLMGAAQGLVIPPTAQASVSAVPKAKTGAASGMMNTFRQTALALGVAIGGSLLVSGYRHRMSTPLSTSGLSAGIATPHCVRSPEP